MESNSENTNNIELKLSDVCRACLTKTDNMLQLFNKTEENTELITMLASIGNFEIEFDELLPLYLCKSCEEKLIISYNFQQLTQRSNEIIQQCLSSNVSIEVDLNELNENPVPVDNNNSELRQENENIEQKLDGVSVVADTTTTTATAVVATKRKQYKTKQTMRLPQFSSDEVAKAIERSKVKFLENCTCIECGFISCNSRALSVHMTHLHKQLKERWCSICNLEVESLTEHYDNTHLNNDLKCEFCNKTFMIKGHYIEHLHCHSNNRPYKCQVCGKGFISSRHLRVHFRIHSNEKPYICQLCSMEFRQMTSLKAHHIKRHLVDEISCQKCQQTFDSDEQLKQHQCPKSSDVNNIKENQIVEKITDDNNSCIRDEINIPHNFCKLCNRKVRSLNVHLKKCHNSPANSEQHDQALCNACGRQFKTNSKLRLHMRIHTGEVPYKCSYCDKRMSSRNQLVVHERIHTGEKPHVCNVCGKAFAQSSVLSTHMRLHTGRPEVCTICKKRFCRPAELRLHMRKHTGEKPFLCTECGQGFKQRSHLMEHLKTHSDERPFKCVHCNKGFKQSSSLKSHVQIHLGFKPFKCSQCPYACRQSYSLTQHMRQHSVDAPRPEKPHVCLVCHKNFSTIAMLMSHTNVAHVMP